MDTAQQSHSQIRQLIVIGLGLIGGSLAKAAKSRGVCEKVVGVARTEDVCERAVELGIVDEAVLELGVLVPSMAEGDVIFIAVPTLSVKSVLQQVERIVPSTVTITDGASVKGSVLKDVREVYGCVPPQVVLGHPIAGSEQSGVEAANPDLYVKHRIIITPTDETGELHLNRVSELWRKVGAEVLQMNIVDHDEILGATSHLPHAIAFSLVDTLAHDSKNENIFRYAAGGFRDFTRIASSDAVMWRDIMLANDKAVIDAIDLFSQNLSRLRGAIEQKDGEALLGVFTRAKAARDHFSAMLERRSYINTDNNSVDLYITSSQSLTGEISVPGDRSISHRAIILASVAEGNSFIEGFVEGEDALATVQAFRDMGVVIEGPDDGVIIVHGVGLQGLSAPAGPLYLGGASTALKLLCGLLSGQEFDTELTTDASLGEISLTSVHKALDLVGAKLEFSNGQFPPVKISGTSELAFRERLQVEGGAQLKSCLLLAALYSGRAVDLQEANPSRDHTERLLKAFGADVTFGPGFVSLNSVDQLSSCRLMIPGDFTSAVIVVIAGVLAQSTSLVIKRVGLNPSRTAALEVIRRFGGELVTTVENDRAEPYGSISISSTSQLKGVTVAPEEVYAIKDELPALMMLAAAVPGRTEFLGVDKLKDIHSKRYQLAVSELIKVGVTCSLTPDRLVIEGGGLVAGAVDAHHDPRLALAFMLLSFCTKKGLLIRQAAGLSEAYPRFQSIFRRIGISIEVIEH